jgi:hypothetical protein
MARLHAIALGRTLAHAVAKRTLLLASLVLAGCAATTGMQRDSEDQFANRRVIYLETSEFRWVDAKERQYLACANGTVLVCTTSLSRLSLSNCGCLPPD